MNTISDLKKRPHRALLLLLPCEDTARRQTTINQEAGPHQIPSLPVP